MDGKQDPPSLWLGKMRQRRHPNVAAVALATPNRAAVERADAPSSEAFKTRNRKSSPSARAIAHLHRSRR